MYPVTQDFLDKIKATERRVYGRIQIDYTDPFLDQSIQVQASEQANVSFPAQTADAVAEPFAKIASLDGSWVLDGTFALAPDPDEADTLQMGWWGSQLAGADGSFTTPYQTLTVTFFSRPITQLKVVGDSKRGEYPVDFDINLYDANGTILYTETVMGNTQITWQKTLDNPITQVTKMDLVVKKWSHAGRQVKILEFFTSIQETYEGDDILLIHLLEEREVSQGSLPVGNISANEIDIRLNNSNRKFDAGNKQSPLYQLLKQNRRIRAWLGLKGNGDGVNIQQSVDFTQGTLNNLVVVNNKLQLPSVANPTFSRNSTAYLSDGTLVNTNIPRFEQGKFDKAIMIEEGTTNRLAGHLDFQTGWIAVSGATVTVTANQTDAFGGTKAYRIQTSGGTSTTKYLYWVDSPSVSGQAYALSMWVKINSSTPVVVYMNIGSRVTVTSTSWQKVTLTCTGNGSTYVGVLFMSQNTSDSLDFSVCYAQFENKSYATSYTDSTRAAETLTIPTAGVLNPQEGTIEFWAYVDAQVRDTSRVRRFFSHFNGTGNANRITIQHNNTPDWLFTIGDNAGNFHTLGFSDSETPDGWHYFAMVWSKERFAVFLDGIKKSELLNPSYLPQSLAATFNIGHTGGNYQCNSLIDDLRISNRARTDEEILAAYQSGQPLPVDEWTTYKLGFDGNLNFGQGGYYLSPEYDLSAVGTVVGSKITWQEDNDEIQRLVYAKLDNQADWVEVANGGKLPINYGDVLTGRKLQLKAKLLKSA